MQKTYSYALAHRSKKKPMSTMVCCLVTGASGALGPEIVRCIASKNATVFAVVRVGVAFSEHHVNVLPCDLACPGNVTTLCAQLKSRNVDVIVMNAALGPATHADPSEILQVNVLSHLQIMRAFPRARVVCVSSRAVDNPWTGCVNSDAYAASKSALESLARSRENEIGSPCYSLVVGAMESKMLRSIVGCDEHIEHVLQPSDVARECARCIFSGTPDHPAVPKRRILLDAGRPRTVVATFRREYEFSASHCLHDPTLSVPENEMSYGKCRQLHGHNYELQVEVQGPIDRFGCVINSQQLDAIVRTHVLKAYDHKHLNDLAHFSSQAPTVERIAEHIHMSLKSALQRDHPPLRLSVDVRETKRNSARVDDHID